jgi:spermidine synthase
MLAPFNPSSEQIQEKAMELLVEKMMLDQHEERRQEHEVLFDLGCGDARLLIACVKKYEHLKCVGVEIEEKFVSRAIESIVKLPSDIQDRICVHHEDALKLPMTTSIAQRTKNISELTLMDDASALYLFVLPKGIEKLMPMLLALVEQRKQEKRNFRILSYMFKIYEWEPTIVDKTSKGGCPIYLYEFIFASS